MFAKTSKYLVKNTNLSLMAGQVAGMLHEVRPVADILADLWDGGRQRIAALSTEC